ncbi:hypothetical protein Scep_016897 [Stephania cephalantha]|uniref:Uncharacterized protein n=1 Tax=Stephania cephalantha TaxID=152367 RepID=A0AAP0INJ3_9MAGN
MSDTPKVNKPHLHRVVAISSKSRDPTGRQRAAAPFIPPRRRRYRVAAAASPALSPAAHRRRRNPPAPPPPLTGAAADRSPAPPPTARRRRSRARHCCRSDALVRPSAPLIRELAAAAVRSPPISPPCWQRSPRGAATLLLARSRCSTPPRRDVRGWPPISSDLLCRRPAGALPTAGLRAALLASLLRAITAIHATARRPDLPLRCAAPEAVVAVASGSSSQELRPPPSAPPPSLLSSSLRPISLS